jgi:hypothetical protein
MGRTKRLLVEAGLHDRLWCPVEVTLEAEGATTARLLDASGQREVPVQVEAMGEGRVRLSWLVDRLERHRTQVYTVEWGKEGEATGWPVTLHEVEGERVEVRIGGRDFTAYHYGSRWARPFLFPVIGPFGDPVTRAYPIEEVPGETRDHPHHKSIWVAHGDVNGVDNWSEERGHGYTRHRTFVRRQEGPIYGELVAENDWTDAEGRRILTERRRFRFYGTPAGVRLMEVEVVFTATEGDVLFGDTKEGGILSVRVATSMDVKQGGRIENAAGGINEGETWGRPAHWCDYSGPVNGNWVGIAILDHPSSFRHPTHWHVRDYGLMTANCFGYSYFYGEPHRRGDHRLAAGESLRFLYRLYIHPGDARAGGVEGQYHNFAHPPQVRVEE